MERGSAGADGAGPRPPGARRPRRLLATGTAVVVLLAVIAVLATRLAGAPSAVRAATTSPTPTPAASLTVPKIYQQVEPSMVLVRTGQDLGTGVIVADDGTILTANHVIAGGGTITVTFADGTTANATVAAADPKLDIATGGSGGKWPEKGPQI
jgi:putative serine protease PepD